jgi:CelD/BcsL family acetyltransferase involved in cellulose biosynthesis
MQTVEIARRTLDQDGAFLLLWRTTEILTSLPAARYAGLHALEPLSGPQSDITGLEERDEVGQIES